MSLSSRVKTVLLGVEGPGQSRRSPENTISESDGPPEQVSSDRHGDITLIGARITLLSTKDLWKKGKTMREMTGVHARMTPNK